MGVLADLNELKPDAYLVIVSIAMLTIPGVAILFHFNPGLFVVLDFFKIVLLSLVFGVSLFVFIFIPVFILLLDEVEKDDSQASLVVIIDVSICFFILLGWLCIAYLNGESLRSYTIQIISSGAVFFLLSIAARALVERKKQKKV